MTATCHRADHASYCDAVAAEIRRFAAVVGGADLATPVPTCPGWTIADVVRHVGGVHRWAAAMVDRLVSERLRSREVDLALPDDVEEWPGWLAAGADVVDAAFRPADPDAPMWAWGSDRHARFWPRRMLHETTVHRADADLALGRAPEIDPAVAVDAVDELLDNLPGAAYFAQGVDDLRGDGERLVLQATDAGVRWAITLLPDRFEWDHGGGSSDPDAVLAAPAADLLLVAYNRRPRGPVAGDEALVDRWLASSAL